MSFEFTKENIDLYLMELAKAYRKQVGKGMPAEVILIGGASVLINYGFRNATTDVDALIKGASAMKDAINIVGDKYNLPNGWLNADFIYTDSYSPKLVEHAKHYRTFSNVLALYTVSGEYLIAMKLRSGRQYKNDLSDIIGILAEHHRRGCPILIDQIQTAVTELYGDWNALPETSRSFISNVMAKGCFEEMFIKVQQDEYELNVLLTEYEKNAPGIVKQSNVDIIIEKLQNESDRVSVLKQLQELQASRPQPMQQSKVYDRDGYDR